MLCGSCIVLGRVATTEAGLVIGGCSSVLQSLMAALRSDIKMLHRKTDSVWYPVS